MSIARAIAYQAEWTKQSLEEYPLVSTEALIGIPLAYLFCMGLGTHMMKGRKPLNLNWFTIPYNFLMSLYNAWFFIGVSSQFFENWAIVNYDPVALVCDPTRVIPTDMKVWWYLFYISKYVEFIDSTVLVLKGKKLLPPENSQFLLHIFHHAVTASIVWAILFYPMSIGWICALTNSWVHFWMYGYYGLVELGLVPRAWGGMFITPMQLIQFVICMGSLTYDLTHQEECQPHPYTLTWATFCYIVFFCFFTKIFIDKKNERRKPRATLKKD